MQNVYMRGYMQLHLYSFHRWSILLYFSNYDPQPCPQSLLWIGVEEKPLDEELWKL